MKKILLITATLLTSAFAHTQAPNTWTRKADFGGAARYHAVGFSIGSKGYIGTGYSFDYSNNQNIDYKDFWEYDPATNAWTQKADFGGTARRGAVGFSIGTKGYLGTGAAMDGFKKDFWEYDPLANVWTQKADFSGGERMRGIGFNIGSKGYIGTGFSFDYRSIYHKDFWEYDPVVNIWTQKADVVGARRDAAGFSIDSKGYIGTGYYEDANDQEIFYKDFWEYDPVTNSWVQRTDFGESADGGVGFSISSKGYIGTGEGKSFREYDPATNLWTQTADFGGGDRWRGVGFNIGSKGYIGTGSISINPYSSKDFWEYTPGNACPAPVNLRVPKISDTCTRLNWNVPNTDVEHIKISYRQLGSTTWIEDRKKAGENSKVICGLTPNTTYEWKVRNICADDKTKWVKGPNFTTLPSPAFSSNTESAIESKARGNATVQIMPNPNKGGFILQMQLPAKSASTTLSLCNNFGATVWQQDAGRLSGSVNRNIALENRLSAGVYVLKVQHGDTRLMQKVVVIK